MAVEALAVQDVNAAHAWAKAWIGSGGGAWIVDPWLVYVASALLAGQPRNAVRSTDVALRHWIADSQDRAVLLWVRGNVVRRRLSDPKSALPDLAVAARTAPPWLIEIAAADRDGCALEATTSRKRKASVGAAPNHEGPGDVAETVARSTGPRLSGGRPPIWSAVADYLA